MTETPRFDDGSEQQVADELDAYHSITQPSASVDEFLEQNNLGIGNYQSDSEMWQQVDRFQDGMFSMAAFSDKILRRAVAETQRHLALKGTTFYDNRNMDAVSVTGWEELDDADQAEESRREFVAETGEEIWQLMDNEQRLEAMEIVTGIDREWTPPHLRILMAEHDLTRSRDARLIDNFFGRIEKLVTESKDNDGGFFGGGS